MAGPGITLVNARLGGGNITSVRVVGSRIAGVGAKPRRDDAIVDLAGDRVLPGLINAHDHLQLNSLPQPELGKRYRHVREWIREIGERQNSDPAFQAGVAIARDQRLLIGGVKNLLSGVTTVAHHDPLYRYLSSPEFPTRVVQHYGWSHSLDISGEQQVRHSYRQTPLEWPWMIHAAEGLDDAAGNEFGRLDALGCLGPNTLLVHGVALDRAQRARLEQSAAGLIWCPTSNRNLFGRTADVADLLARGRVALGTDSRLSGARDLLDEISIAGEIGGLDGRSLERLVTHDSARLLRLPDRGELRADARADILILPARTGLAEARRADVRLVLIDGVVRYGDRDCAQRVAPASRWAEVRVDGRAKILDRHIAALLARSDAQEVGLELPTMSRSAA